MSANKERDELDDQHQELQREYDLLQAQHADLKSTCTTHENERRKVERSIAVLQKKCAVAESTEQIWRENCKTAQRDAQNARKEKEELDEGLKELAERARGFEHRAHRNKVAYDKYKGKYEALKEENACLQKIQQTVEAPEEQSLLFPSSILYISLQQYSHFPGVTSTCSPRYKPFRYTSNVRLCHHRLALPPKRNKPGPKDRSKSSHHETPVTGETS